MKDIYKILDDLDIQYKKYEHPAVFTCEEADKHCQHIEGGRIKNLFLRSKKARNYYLVVAPDSKKVDLKQLAKDLGEKGFSFASAEELKEHLGLDPGSVSPLGLINDESNGISVVIDNDLLSHKELGMHPNINTATLVINTNDFKKFLDSTGNRVSSVDL